MPQILPGGFILEDDEPSPGAPAPPPGGFVLEDEQAPPFPVTQGEWQGPPPPPPPESGFWSTLGHSAYGLGKGAIAGTLGWPGNVLQGMPWTS